MDANTESHPGSHDDSHSPSTPDSFDDAASQVPQRAALTPVEPWLESNAGTPVQRVANSWRGLERVPERVAGNRATAASCLLLCALLRTTAVAVVGASVSSSMFPGAAQLTALTDEGTNPRASAHAISFSSAADRTPVGSYLDDLGYRRTMVAVETRGAWMQPTRSGT
jgi:hypothetical protein